jgi:hypothetical protein
MFCPPRGKRYSLLFNITLLFNTYIINDSSVLTSFGTVGNPRIFNTVRGKGGGRGSKCSIRGLPRGKRGGERKKEITSHLREKRIIFEYYIYIYIYIYI